MKLTPRENTDFRRLLRGWSDTRSALQMQQYIQHGRVTTYEHCLSVARISFWLNRRLHLGANEKSLVRGAFLHDFYLYDWHQRRSASRWHGFRHPAIALRNASASYSLDEREKNIIVSHMWPLTLTRPPHCREAALVCLADKGCSLHETLFQR